MTKVILINGPARSGKDTLADHMNTISFRNRGEVANPCVPFKFAGTMQRFWRGVFSAACQGVEFSEYTDGDKKNEAHPALGFSFRAAMINFSEDYIKPTYGVNFFGKITAMEIEAEADYYDRELVAVVSDSGFKEEAVAVIERFGAENVLLVKLYRPGFSFTGDSRSYINLDEFGVKTVELENIELEQFKRDGQALITEFIGA